MAKKKKLAWLLIIIFSLVLLINIMGILIELLFGFGVLKTDVVKIRSLSPIPLILSVGFIIAGITFIIYLYKLDKKVILWWHIFMGIGLLSILSSIIQPTLIYILIPYYYIISISFVVIIWLLIFLYLKKLKSQPIHPIIS